MPAVTETLDTVQALTQSGYKWGFETEIETDFVPVGLTEDTVRLTSARKSRTIITSPACRKPSSSTRPARSRIITTRRSIRLS